MKESISKATTEASAGFAAAEAAAIADRKPFVLDDAKTGKVLLYTPTGDGGWTQSDLTQALPAPLRLVQGQTLTSPQAFVDYVRLFAKADQSIVFAKPPLVDPKGEDESAKFLAVIDYHKDAASPSWNGHQAKLTLLNTPSWLDWSGSDDEFMDQVTFARFLEERIPDIADPAGAVLVDLARAFEALGSVAFKSVEVARNGTRQIKYEETVKEVPQPGSMGLPEEITLMLAPFVGTERRPIKARIRFQIERGSLRLKYQLVRPEDVLMEAYGDARVVIADGLKDSVRAVIDAVI
jgi:uncharacterized protein YfdQ (DUF2303 family)